MILYPSLSTAHHYCCTGSSSSTSSGDGSGVAEVVMLVLVASAPVYFVSVKHFEASIIMYSPKIVRSQYNLEPI